MKIKRYVNYVFLIFIIILAAVFFTNEAGAAFDRGEFKGRVLDQKGHGVMDAQIFVYDSPDSHGPAAYVSLPTGFDGTFMMRLPAGTYWAVARPGRDKQYDPLMMGDDHPEEPLKISIIFAGEYEQDFTVTDIREEPRQIVKPASNYFPITGKVLDKSGIPVRDIYVFANPGMNMSGIPEYISAWTDAQGLYSLYLPAGRCYIGYASEFPPNEQNRILKELHVPIEQKDFNIIIDFIEKPAVNNIQ
jgi:hypothetical protein